MGIKKRFMWSFGSHSNTRIMSDFTNLVGPEFEYEGNTYQVISTYVSELGFLMLKTQLMGTGTYKTFNLGVYNKTNNIFVDLLKNRT